jgi:DNA polymerase elongation subunit (family B)
MLYETDADKCKLKSMGNVLKRRDNAPIVKDIYGGVINILMMDKEVEKSIKFVDNCLENMVNEIYPIEKLVVTKSLRGFYKNPNQIAHKVLANRMGHRDPGNKPGPGDRVNYAYIKNPDKKALQGEKIESPDYIKEANLKLDYGHYITNQIMKPLQQLFALELENISSFKEKWGPAKWQLEYLKLREKWTDGEKFIKKYEEMRMKEIKVLIFDKYLKNLK